MNMGKPSSRRISAAHSRPPRRSNLSRHAYPTAYLSGETCEPCASLPSSSAAADVLAGTSGGVPRFIGATALRSGLIFPGLLLAGVAFKRAALGALLSSGMISGFVLAYLALKKKEGPRAV